MLNLARRIVRTLEMIRFSHSVFALPFALAGVLFACYDFRAGELLVTPTVPQITLIIACCVLARSAAMGFNRYADADIDAANPRTATRHLPTRQLSPMFVLSFSISCALLFVICAFMLNALAGVLSFPALILLFGYSYTKRFTPFTHWVLGLALAVAPAGGYIALRGELSIEVCLLAFAVLCWTAGFDIIYACQDAEHDRHNNLQSFPAVLGVPAALRASQLMYACFLICIISANKIIGISDVLTYSYALVALLLLLMQHLLVKPDSLQATTIAFRINGAVSPLYLLALLIAANAK